MTQTVLITGASGRIGRHAARAFADAGWTVRRFARGNDMAAAAQGAQVIVNGMNPPNYHDWARIQPAITAEHIAAARATGATVILPGNVYNFGPVCDGAWSGTSPHEPQTRKGRIREDIEAMYRDAGVRTIVLRAGNFIDPDDDTDVMGIMHLRGLARGKLGLSGRPDARQAWCYLPDWARAAVALAERRDDLTAFEDVPFDNLTFTAHELQATLERLTGHSLRATRFPWWAMHLLAPVWELAREMREMRYLYDLDHALDGARLHELIPGWRGTSLEAALQAKLARRGATAPDGEPSPA